MIIFQLVNSATSKLSPCLDALRQLSCLLFFPECEQSAASFSSIEPYPTCTIMCTIAQKACGKLDCSYFSNSNHGQCSLYIPTGYLILPPDLVSTIFEVVLGSGNFIAFLLRVLTMTYLLFIFLSWQCGQSFAASGSF